MPLPAFVCDELSLLANPGVDPDALVFRSPDGTTDPSDLVPTGASGTRPSQLPVWLRSGSTTSATRPCRCGSRMAANPKQVAAMAGHTSVSVVLDRYGPSVPAARGGADATPRGASVVVSVQERERLVTAPNPPADPARPICAASGSREMCPISAVRGEGADCYQGRTPGSIRV